MAQGRARAFLKQKGIKDYNDLMDQWETLQSENVESQGWASIGSLLGKGAAMLIPGLPLWGAMLAAGIGSRAGSEIGEHAAGHGGVRGGEAITPVGTQSGTRRQIQSTAEDAYGQFGDQQLTGAIKDAVSTYSLGGGSIIPGEGGIFGELSKASMTGYDKLLGGKTLMDIFNKQSTPSPIDIDTMNQGNFKV
tara:strand:+ start:683 stop:1258 length:576 start_codon:yes stop_codon:yes gene_type:complete